MNLLKMIRHKKLAFFFSDYDKDKGRISFEFSSEIESDGEKSYEKLSKLNLKLEKSIFDDNKSVEEKFEGINVIRLTRKQ